MKITALTFTCARDRERASYHQQFLPQSWKKVWCVEPKDADIDVPAGTQKLVRDFPRGKTLRHADAIEGMRQVYLELAKETDLLVKIDSDTALFRPEAFSAPFEFAGIDFTYIRRLSIESRLLCNGCCYAASKRALLRLAQNFRLSDFPENFGGHEDLIFSAFWTIKNKDLTLAQIDKLKWSWCEHPYIAADTFGAHNGYISKEDDFALCEKIKKLKNLNQ